MTHEEAEAAINAAQRYVASLGLHGVLMLAGPCASCGQCHDFYLASDLNDGEAERLIQHFADVIAKTPEGARIMKVVTETGLH